MVAQVLLAICPGEWFVTFNLENACWHISIDLMVLALPCRQVEDNVLLFTVHPFGLSIALTAFSRIMKLVANAHSHLGVEMLMYLDCLIQAPDLS